MYMKIFRKLIRDKMPEKLQAEGKEHAVRVLEDDTEYFEWLRRKLIEEIQEMTEEPDNTEFIKTRLAYLYEIIDIMRNVKGFSAEEIELRKNKIIEERGSFDKRLLLEP
jgi:predicted house-cleaning noncanonical NTP pyrophosphatase (MazG superfamily)